VYNLITKRQDCIQSYETRDAGEAFALHLDYKKKLKGNNFNVVKAAPVNNSTLPQSVTFLKTAAKMYSDFLQDVNVPPQEQKKLSPMYIKDNIRNLTRFLEIVQKKEKKIANFPVDAVTSEHVTAFHDWIKNKELSLTSYNAHMKACSYFFKWVIKGLKVKMDNPFENVKIREVYYDPEIIPVEEFEKLLSVITPENGIGTKGVKKKENVNYYRPWLKKAIGLSLLIGERLDGVVLLRWTHINGNFFKIPNFKVERIQKTDGKYYSYTPITADLAELLVQFDMTDQEGYIVEPSIQNRETLKRFISKAFTHFWKVTGNKRKVTFKNLRKTYETLLTSAIGEKAMYVKHNNDKTAIKHYLDKQKLLEAAKDVRLYDTSAWFK
jgi:integrase